MLRRNFFEKQLEQLATAIAKSISEIMNLKADEKTDAALEIADNTLKDEFSLDLKKLTALNNDSFIDQLTEEKKLTSRHLNYLGDLLFETALLVEIKNETEKTTNLYQKTLLIYEYVNTKEKTFSKERQEKIEQLKRKL